MQFEVKIEIPDELFEKLNSSRLELGEKELIGINTFKNLNFRKEFIKDSLENLTGWEVISIKLVSD